MNDLRVAGHRALAVLARFSPLVLLVLLAGILAIVMASGVDDYLTFEALRIHRQSIQIHVDAHPILAPLLFILIYALTIALFVPGAAVLTISGGFLFGTWIGSGAAVVGATAGAVAVHLAAGTVLGDVLRHKAGARLQSFQEGFRKDDLSYLLALRLLPVFPFWLINLVPALLGVPLRPYVIATFLGIMPASIVYASIGNGLGVVFDQGDVPDLGIIYDPVILGPILGLALLALLPAICRHWRGHHEE